MRQFPAICTVINYCTNDYRYLNLCIKEAKYISSQIIIPVCDHFFNGVKENQALLERSYAKHPDCLFVEYAYDPKQPYGLHCPFTETDEDWAHYWHSTSRYVGMHFVEEPIDYVLFLDVDEIVDGARFRHWLTTFAYDLYEALRFYSYFYFRSPEHRALSYTSNALLVKKRAVSYPEVLLTERERGGVFDNIPGTKLCNIIGDDGTPLVDHYSWVRSKEELLLKVSSWGHRQERDWASLIEEEFAHPFLGTEKFFYLRYEQVAARVDPLKEWGNTTPVSSAAPFDHVIKTSSQDLRRQALLRDLAK